MKFLSKVKLSNRRYKTPEGYLVCVDSIIARTGKQEYLKSEIFQDSNDDSVIQIDRPKSEVLSPSTIASFENKPLVDEHPDEDVNVDNYRDYAIGFARDVRASKLDNTDILIANLIFTDPEAIAEIESGEKTELSCGYDCDILGEGDNLYQANIRGNHIALCKAGRAGIARIQDSKMKDSKIKLSRQNALDIFEDIEDDIHWYNSRYNCRFDLNDDYLVIEGNRKNLENIIKEYRLSDYNVKIIDSRTSKEIREVANNRYSEKLKDLSPEERSKKIDELIADEEEAIVGYKEAMKYANEADKSIYAHIIAEELEHITELKTLRAESFEKNNINDAGTTRRMFRESEIGDENSWFGTTDWGTPKGNMYIYRKNGKIIAEGVYNGWNNDLQKGEKKEFNSVKELNKWLNTFTEDSNIKDIEKKEFTYNGFDVYLVGRTSDDAHYEIRYKDKGVAGCDYSEDPKKEIDKLNLNVVTIYGITTERKWNISHGRAKPERTFTSLSEAQYEQKRLEREDGIPYVIFVEKEITYINNKKFFEDEENKKMRDGALRGIHLKKIRNTLRNEDEDLVEDFLDYMDTRPDLVKEYDDYSDYMVREDFETWKKYKKIKTRDVDTYEEVTEDLEKELKDSDTLKNLAYKFAQIGSYFDRAHSLNSRKILGKEDDEKIPEFYNLGLQVYKQLEQEVDYLKNNKSTNSNRDYGFLSETVSLLEDGVNGLNMIKDEKCKLLSKKIDNLLYEYKKHTYRDSKVKDSYVEEWWGQTIEEPKLFAKKYGLTVVALKRNMDETLYRFYGPTKNIEKAMKDGYFYNPERYVKDEKKIIKNASDSKVKDSSCTITVLEDILWDDEMRKRTRKYNLDAKKLEVYKFWKSMYGVWVISGDRDNIKKFLKENELAIGKNPEIKDSAKLLNIIKLYKKATKDSKVKDSMTKVNIETSLSIFDLQKAARKFDVIVILSNYTDHVYAILKGEKEDIGDLLSYLDNKGVLMKYPKGF